MSAISPIQRNLLNSLADSQKALLESGQRLATGSSITRASDNPAGLIASNQLSAQLAALEGEARAIERSDAFARRADAALAEAGAMYALRDSLEVAAANSGAMSDAERDAIALEIASIDEAAGRILNSASFAGVPVFDGQRSVRVPEGDFEIPAAGDLRGLDAINAIRGSLGAFHTNAITSRAGAIRSEFENIASANSVIRDTDFAAEIAHFTKLQALQQAGNTALSIANSSSQSLFALLSG